jgi:surface antigen Omp85-like protein
VSVLWLLASLALAQNPAPAPVRPDSGPLPQPPDSGKFKITPLLAPAYNPEMQFLIAGGVLLSWKVGANPLRIQRSTLSSTVSISSIGAINVSTTLSSFWNEDRFRLNADLAFKDMDDNYWGVGFDAGLAPSESDSTTAYHRRWFKFSPRVVWRVKGGLLVGGVLDLNKTEATEINSTMLQDPTFRQFGSSNSNAGVGLVVQYDTRDVAANAWKGVYAGLTITTYGGWLGGDNQYETYLLDYRQYQSLGRAGRTFAWQIKSRIGAHNIPWPEFSMLGTGYDLRGYVEGRFRDRSTVIGLAEYRHMFVRSSGRLSRHGFVVWAGGGTLGPDIARLHGFLPNGGFGYRLELQPRSNVRVDFGFGRNSRGIYFNFTEAY